MLHLRTPKEGKLTCETLWLAQSDSGDYHKNMDSKKFMLWVKTCLIPTFKAEFPGKKMVLIMDNAPYHHKRAIRSLSAIKKDILVDLMNEYGVDSIDLPMNSQERYNLLDDGTDVADDFGSMVEIDFDPEEQKA